MPKRIFLGLGEICGFYSQLEDGFKKLGVDCMYVNAWTTQQAYQRTHKPDLLGQFVEWVGYKRFISPRRSLRRIAWSILQQISLFILLLATLPRFDTYIFLGGTTFFFGMDLRLLKLLKKRVIVTLHGSDSRPPYLSAAEIGTEGEIDIKRCVKNTLAIKKKIRHLDRYTDAIVSHALYAHFHEKKLVSWLAVGNPYDVSKANAYFAKDKQERPQDDTCIIVHAPTRPGPKGSPQIEKAINHLIEKKGYRIRFVKLVGRPNAEVLHELSQCDFAVDELFSDMTMCGFATEAAAFGKPSIVGMHDFPELKRHAEPETIGPSLICHPDDVENAIERLIVDVEFRQALGKKAKEFIETNWRGEQVAARFLTLAEGNTPSNWLIDPYQIRYIHGWGLTENRLKEVTKKLLENYGPTIFQVDDKPVFKDILLDFATK